MWRSPAIFAVCIASTLTVEIMDILPGNLQPPAIRAPSSSVRRPFYTLPEQSVFSLPTGYLPPDLGLSLASEYLPPPPSTRARSKTPASKYQLPEPIETTEPNPSYLPPDVKTVPPLSSLYLPPTDHYRPAQTNFIEDITREQPTGTPSQPTRTIFFEEDYFVNKANEQGFCEQYCSAVRRPSVVKPGRCPRPKPTLKLANCTDKCLYDSECEGDQRCCFVGCGNVCVRPETQITCADLQCKDDTVCIGHANEDAQCVSTKPSPGRCPKPANSSTSAVTNNCKETCRFDAECEAGEKCCFNGCANTCRRADFKVTCDDIQCEENEICLSYPTKDSRCVSLEKREGRCPKAAGNVTRYNSKCENNCRLDDECPENWKCCSSGCGNTCVEPDLKVTCADLTCKYGKECIDHETKDAECVSTKPKDGRCPKRSNYTDSSRICKDECRYDAQCRDDQKCCSNGCANVCSDANFKITCEDLTCKDEEECIEHETNDSECVTTKPKVGRCPKINYNDTNRICKDECRYDAQCEGDQKCCFNGCANTCAEAKLKIICLDLTCKGAEECIEYATKDSECVSTVPKQGFCPKISNNTGLYRSCDDECRYDAQCEGNQKCCSNGCGLQCSEPRRADCEITKCKVGQECQLDQQGNPQCKPIPCNQDGEVVDIECNSCTCIQGFLLCAQEECPPTKPGFCPRLVRGYRGECGENCDSDYDCPGEDKCCNTGCGRGCKQPIPKIVHPCRTVRFRCGDQTRCAATRGLCQPGKPCPLVPLCVSKQVPFCESCPDGKVCVLQKKACPEGRCDRQPICIQLYSDETPFEENDELEKEVVARQQASLNTV